MKENKKQINPLVQSIVDRIILAKVSIDDVVDAYAETVEKNEKYQKELEAAQKEIEKNTFKTKEQKEAEKKAKAEAKKKEQAEAKAKK